MQNKHKMASISDITEMNHSKLRNMNSQDHKPVSKFVSTAPDITSMMKEEKNTGKKDSIIDQNSDGTHKTKVTRKSFVKSSKSMKSESHSTRQNPREFFDFEKTVHKYDIDK